jgi:hypothetical protein
VRYYFLMASLPGLALGEPLPLDGGEFTARAASQLDPADAAELRAVRAGAGDSPLALRWLAFERHLRNTVARQRAQRLQADPAPWLREGERWELFVLEAVEDAYARPNPLERELELDRCRWRRLDELAVGHPFDLDAVLIYGLRLGLCARWAGLDAARGQAVVDSFLEQGKAAS